MRQRASRAAGLLLLLLAGLAAFLLLRSEGLDPGADDLAEERSAEARAPAEAVVEGAPALAADGRGGTKAGSRQSTAATGAAAPEETASDTVVAVDPKGPFQGVCVDEEDRPVAGATVLVVNGRAGGRGVDRGAFAPARSDADGRFEIPAPETVESVRIRASGAGRVAVRADEEMTRGRLTRIVLLRAVEVRVRVLEEGTGGAVRGARVSLFAGEENANRDDVDFALHPPINEASTDETGRAVLLGPGGPCALLAKAPDRAPRLVAPLHVPAVGMDLTVVLERGATILGHVLGEDELPVVGARVHATARLGWRAEGTSDADGMFRFEGVPWSVTSHEEPLVGGPGVAVSGLQGWLEEESWDPVAVMLVVEAEGYALHTFEWEILERRGDPREVQLHRAGPVSGTVAAVASAFPPGTTLRLVPSRPIPEGVSVPALPTPLPMAPDGSFRFDDVAVLPVDLVVEDADGNALPADLDMTWSGGSRRKRTSRRTVSAPVSDSRLQKSEPWLVRVLDAADEGVAGAHLELGFGDERVLHVQARAITDSEGRARVEGLHGAPRAVVVYPPGRPTFSLRPSQATVADRAVTVTLPTGRARGRVRRLDGKPGSIGLAVGTALRGIGAPETTVGRLALVVGTDGAFVVEGLGDDDYRISADSPFVLVRPPLVKPGAVLDLLAVTPAEAVSLQVEVRLEPPAGGVVNGGFLILEADGRAADICQLDATGENGVWLSSPPVPPGVYRATVVSGIYKPTAVPSIRIDGGDRSPRITVKLE